MTLLEFVIAGLAWVGIASIAGSVWVWRFGVRAVKNRRQG